MGFTGVSVVSFQFRPPGRESDTLEMSNYCVGTRGTAREPLAPRGTRESTSNELADRNDAHDSLSAATCNASTALARDSWSLEHSRFAILL